MPRSTFGSGVGIPGEGGTAFGWDGPAPTFRSGVGEDGVSAPGSADGMVGKGGTVSRGAGVEVGDAAPNGAMVGTSGLGAGDVGVLGTGPGNGFALGVTELGVAEAEGGLGGGANRSVPRVGRPEPPAAGSVQPSGVTDAGFFGAGFVAGAGGSTGGDTARCSLRGLAGDKGVESGWPGDPPGAAVFSSGVGDGTEGLESLFLSSSPGNGFSGTPAGSFAFSFSLRSGPGKCLPCFSPAFPSGLGTGKGLASGLDFSPSGWGRPSRVGGGGIGDAALGLAGSGSGTALSGVGLGAVPPEAGVEGEEGKKDSNPLAGDGAGGGVESLLTSAAARITLGSMVGGAVGPGTAMTGLGRLSPAWTGAAGDSATGAEGAAVT